MPVVVIMCDVFNNIIIFFKLEVLVNGRADYFTVIGKERTYLCQAVWAMIFFFFSLFDTLDG